MKTLGDVLALLSALAFAFPAGYANRCGRLLAKMNLGNLHLGEPEFQEEHAALSTELTELRDGWKPWKGWCFWVGTVTGVVALILVLVAGFSEPAAVGGAHT